jgi:SAM-dependent methyltransferase
MVGHEDLHFGFFIGNKNKQDLNLIDLKEAQNNYSELIINNIPKGTKNILDVGSGCGTIAKKLLDKHYVVDCVSPDPFLTERIIKNTNNKVNIYESTFENINNKKKYDLILFSESFQYINMEKAFDHINNLLKPDGYFIICDFFKKDSCTITGGHKWTIFQSKIAKRDNFTLTYKQDITKETSITYDLINNIYSNFMVPISGILSTYFNGNYPILSYFFKCINITNLKKKIKKIQMETGECFIKNKYYFLLIYQKDKDSKLE